jgi:antitoxin component of MazEF toxin-antitoxin module
MKVVKVRRVGNSNVISIPREFEARGYAPGSSVLVEELSGGELRIMSTEKVRERIHDIGERVVAEHGEALQILADHDPESAQH